MSLLGIKSVVVFFFFEKNVDKRKFMIYNINRVRYSEVYSQSDLLNQ